MVGVVGEVGGANFCWLCWLTVWDSLSFQKQSQTLNLTLLSLHTPLPYTPHCPNRTTDPHLLYFQHTRTYMKDYPALIAAIKQGYSLRSWWDAYKGFNGGEGRDGCWKPKSGSEWPAPVDPKKCEHGWGPDGQKNRKRKWDNEDHYLERAVAGGAGAGDSSDQFCSKECKPTEASAKWGGVRGVDCRRESDVREEKERKVNQEEAYVPP